MNFFGLNRAALNGSVTGLIAGAAIAIASSSSAANGTRIVLPSAVAVSSSDATAKGVRNVFGSGAFVSTASITAFPALLQLTTANIVVTSALKASYTNAYAASTGTLQADGYIIRAGGGTASAISTGMATPLVAVGYASNINVMSSATADASVKLSGQTTWQRDGYASVAAASMMVAESLRTALPTAWAGSSSSCTSEGIKMHGGAAQIHCVWTMTAVASSDSALSVASSYATAAATVTQFGSATAYAQSDASADRIVITFGLVEPSVAISSAVADGRLALLGDAEMTGLSNAFAAGRTALRGDATIGVISTTTADGAIHKLADALSVATSDMTAAWQILRFGFADLVGSSAMTATAMTNVEAPDPPSRTVSRPFTGREVRRPYVNREMRRSA